MRVDYRGTRAMTCSYYYHSPRRSVMAVLLRIPLASAAVERSTLPVVRRHSPRPAAAAAVEGAEAGHRRTARSRLKRERGERGWGTRAEREKAKGTSYLAVVGSQMALDVKS